MANTVKSAVYLAPKYNEYFEQLVEETGLGKSGVITMVLKHYKDYQETIQGMNQVVALTARLEELEKNLNEKSSQS